MSFNLPALYYYHWWIAGLKQHLSKWCRFLEVDLSFRILALVSAKKLVTEFKIMLWLEFRVMPWLKLRRVFVAIPFIITIIPPKFILEMLRINASNNSFIKYCLFCTIYTYQTFLSFEDVEVKIVIKWYEGGVKSKSRVNYIYEAANQRTLLPLDAASSLTSTCIQHCHLLEPGYDPASAQNPKARFIQIPHLPILQIKTPLFQESLVHPLLENLATNIPYILEFYHVCPRPVVVRFVHLQTVCLFGWLHLICHAVHDCSSRSVHHGRIRAPKLAAIALDFCGV